MTEAKNRQRSKYRTTNWKAYKAALTARGSLTMWLDQSVQWLGTPSGKRGGSTTFSDAALKCLFGQPLRQALGTVQSLLQLAKLDWLVPDFSTVCRRQNTLQVELSYKPSKSPLQSPLQLQLQLLVDSTGIKFLNEGEWKRKKHGAEYRREGRKVHLGIDAQTLETPAIEVTTNAIGDAPMLPELLAQIPLDEPIESVCADGAYDTRGCLDAIAERQAMALIPPRKNASHWRKSSAGSAQRNETIRACKRLGRSIWRKWSGYHWRSLVETKMHSFKRLGERVTARTFERQVVELHVRVALLNRFSQIGRPRTVPVAAVVRLRLGLGLCRLRFDLCNRANLYENALKSHLNQLHLRAPTSFIMCDTWRAWLTLYLLCSPRRSRSLGHDWIGSRS